MTFAIADSNTHKVVNSLYDSLVRNIGDVEVTMIKIKSGKGIINMQFSTDEKQKHFTYVKFTDSDLKSTKAMGSRCVSILSLAYSLYTKMLIADITLEKLQSTVAEITIRPLTEQDTKLFADQQLAVSYTVEG